MSLGINYPNKSDKIIAKAKDLGGDIFIHGNCVTIGCVPITDSEIKELYVFCIEAKNNGQKNIPVTIFPKQLTDENFKALASIYAEDGAKLELWTDLKEGWDYFYRSHQLPEITFLATGRHLINRYKYTSIIEIFC